MDILKTRRIRISIGLILVSFAILFLYRETIEKRFGGVPAESTTETREQELIRRSTAPLDAVPQLQGTKKQDVIKNTSAPTDAQPILTKEERQNILESTSAP